VYTVGNEFFSLSFKKKQKIGPWNVRSLYEGKMDVVLQEMKRTNIKMLGLSEVRWSGKCHFQAEEYTMYYSGHESTKANGVGIICHREIASAVMEYNPVNDRIMTIRLQGKTVNMTIIQPYAPTTAADEDTVA